MVVKLKMGKVSSRDIEVDLITYASFGAETVMENVARCWRWIVEMGLAI